MADVDAAFIARTLDASRRQHAIYRTFSPRMTSLPGQPQPTADMGDADQAFAALSQAHDLRAQAHANDPDHTAPAWALEPVPHAEMMAYYAHVLGV